MKAFLSRIDDVALVAWQNPVVRRVGVAVVVTMVGDFLSWHAQSGVVVYLQHLADAVWPIVHPILVAAGQ